MAGFNSFNFNLRDVPKACIERLPKGAVAAYRGSPDQANDFCEALRTQLSDYGWGEVNFDNIDVSQVQWDALSFSILMDVLIEKGVSSVRFKAFKCGLDDESIKLIASWLDGLPAENMPSELHLSNNQITNEGFDALLASLDGKRAELAQQASPVWVRVENNKVDEASLKELEGQGKLIKVAALRDRRPGQAVMAMPSFAGYSKAAATTSWSGGGKSGGPSWWAGGAAAGAAATGWSGSQASAGKWGGGGGGTSWPAGGASGGAWDRSSAGSKGGKGGAWDSGGGSAGYGGRPATQALAAPVARAGYGAPARQMPAQQQRPAVTIQQRPQTFQAFGSAARTNAADRSRTPVSAAARKPAEPAKPKLPPGWSSEWSEEYQIPYFWHADSGESVWEPPTK